MDFGRKNLYSEHNTGSRLPRPSRVPFQIFIPGVPYALGPENLREKILGKGRKNKREVFVRRFEEDDFARPVCMCVFFFRFLYDVVIPQLISRGVTLIMTRAVNQSTTIRESMRFPLTT